MLDRLRGEEDPNNLLRLPSRVTMPTDVRRERDRSIAIEAARVQVQLTRIQGVTLAGEVGMFCAARLSQVAEVAASVVPAERARVDAPADAAAAAIARLVMELGI
jgi:hypothetical protein